jgi:hypothetical protein
MEPALDPRDAWMLAWSLDAEEPPERFCEHCGVPLAVGMRRDARFCSDSHRACASRARLKRVRLRVVGGVGFPHGYPR